MKKVNVITLLFLFVFLGSNLYSQEALKEESYSLSGSIKFLAGSNESINAESDNLTLSMTPEFGYFMVDNFLASLSISYFYSEFTWKSSGQEFKNINRHISVGPKIRYYFESEKYIPFLEAGYQYSNSLVGNEDMNRFSIAGGINYFLSKSVALEPYIEYSKENYILGDQKISSFSIGLRINYFIVN